MIYGLWCEWQDEPDILFTHERAATAPAATIAATAPFLKLCSVVSQIAPRLAASPQIFCPSCIAVLLPWAIPRSIVAERKHTEM